MHRLAGLVTAERPDRSILPLQEPTDFSLRRRPLWSGAVLAHQFLKYAVPFDNCRWERERSRNPNIGEGCGPTQNQAAPIRGGFCGGRGELRDFFIQTVFVGTLESGVEPKLMLVTVRQ